MTEHYTAWVTTDRTCLDSDFADVVVLRDKAAGTTVTDSGAEVTHWTSTGDPHFQQETTVRHDGDDEEIINAATDILEQVGWEVVDDEWQPVDTGYITAVKPADD